MSGKIVSFLAEKSGKIVSFLRNDREKNSQNVKLAKKIRQIDMGITEIYNHTFPD